MSWEGHDGLERGGDCNRCGDAVEQEYHAYCSACYRIEMGWDDDDDVEDVDRCEACERPLVELRDGRLVCPNPHCTARGAA
jgi:NMD protein affecting ribosome stability and mRNA decay